MKRLARSDMALTIISDAQPVPACLAGKSCANLWEKWQWDMVGAVIAERSGGKCEICGRRAVSVHEYWYYNEMTKVQQLVGFLHCCAECHDCMHLAGVKRMIDCGKRPRYWYDDLRRHWCRVTGWGVERWEQYRSVFIQMSKRRAMERWTQHPLPSLRRALVMVNSALRWE